MFGVNELSLEEAEQRIKELNHKLQTECFLFANEEIPVLINGKYYIIKYSVEEVSWGYQN